MSNWSYQFFLMWWGSLLRDLFSRNPSPFFVHIYLYERTSFIVVNGWQIKKKVICIFSREYALRVRLKCNSKHTLIRKLIYASQLIDVIRSLRTSTIPISLFSDGEKYCHNNQTMVTTYFQWGWVIWILKWIAFLSF